MQYIVDGYNYLFALNGDIGNFEQARKKLLKTLSRFAKDFSLSFIVVFDAHKQPEKLSVIELDSLEVVYTDEGQTADEYILELLEYSSRPSQITLVSDDVYLCRQAKTFGAKTIKPKDFYILLNSKNNQKFSLDEGKPSHISGFDLKRYLNIFGKKKDN